MFMNADTLLHYPSYIRAYFRRNQCQINFDNWGLRANPKMNEMGDLNANNPVALLVSNEETIRATLDSSRGWAGWPMLKSWYPEKLRSLWPP